MKVVIDCVVLSFPSENKDLVLISNCAVKVSRSWRHAFGMWLDPFTSFKINYEEVIEILKALSFSLVKMATKNIDFFVEISSAMTASRNRRYALNLRLIKSKMVSIIFSRLFSGFKRHLMIIKTYIINFD